MADEKIYTVPLRKGFLKAPKYARTKKAVKVLKEHLAKHLKKEVKVGKHLNLELWKHGRKNPPSKIKIRIDEVDDKSIAELINALTSFGKQQPPYPSPALRNFGPIRLSKPIALATS